MQDFLRGEQENCLLSRDDRYFCAVITVLIHQYYQAQNFVKTSPSLTTKDEKEVAAAKLEFAIAYKMFDEAHR
jgi:hypothetical protein